MHEFDAARPADTPGTIPPEAATSRQPIVKKCIKPIVKLSFLDPESFQRAINGSAEEQAAVAEFRRQMAAGDGYDSY